MTVQYRRAWNILVGSFIPGTTTFNTGGQVLQLSSNNPGYDLRCHFEIRASDVETPNTATIRIYNLSEATSKTLSSVSGIKSQTYGPSLPGQAQEATIPSKSVGEFTAISVQAGPATIFAGTIKQIRRGRLNATDSYVDIFAGDGDAAYNFGRVNTTLDGPQANPDAIAAAVGTSFAQYNVGNQIVGLSGGVIVNPRGKVMYGMGRSVMRDLAVTQQSRWSIQNGQLQMIKLNGYLPGTAVELNAYTGMIGVPESTPNGILVDCLLNPLIKIGGLVKINNKDIAQADIKQLYGYPDYRGMTFFATTDDDGVYKVLVHEIEGDTRENPWYSHLTCLLVDVSAPAGKQIKPYDAGGATPQGTVSLGKISVLP